MKELCECCGLAAASRQIPFEDEHGCEITLTDEVSYVIRDHRMTVRACPRGDLSVSRASKPAFGPMRSIGAVL